MRPSDKDLQTLGPFNGANNLSRETSVPRKAARELRNVVPSDDGKVRRRPGYTRVEDLTNGSSVVGDGRRGFVNDGGTLYAFEVINGAPTALFPIWYGLRPGARLASTKLEPDLFLSDGDQNLRVAPDNTVTPWSLPQPAAPGLTVSPGGALPRGRYRVHLTARAGTPAEGAASEGATVEIAEDGSRLTVEFPPYPDAATRYCVYMTKPNGTEPLLVAVAPNGASSLDLYNPYLGRACPTLGAYPMPPAEFALYYRSRLWVAAGNVLTASLPFQYAVTEAEFAWMSFGEQITGIGSAGEVGGGFFVGQESRVYYITGAAPDEMSLAEKYPAGMVAHTLQMVPGARLPMQQPPSEPVPVWLATNGVVCAGLPDGTVLPLTETSFATAVAARGAGAFIQRDGSSLFVATVSEPSDNVFAVQDEAIFEIVRNGIPETV